MNLPPLGWSNFNSADSGSNNVEHAEVGDEIGFNIRY